MRRELNPVYVNHLDMVEVFNIFILELSLKQDLSEKI